jgi:hypothetical protein
VWLDLWAETSAGDSVTVTDASRTGMLDRPPWKRQVRLPGAGVREMLAALAAAAPVETIAFEAEELPRRFEVEWAREVAWRAQRGVRPAEVDAVARRMREEG